MAETKMDTGEQPEVTKKKDLRDFRVFQKRATTTCMLAEDLKKIKMLEAELREPKQIIAFRPVMKQMQTSVALEHAKKVKENKGSVSINMSLRTKYKEKFCRFFPDPVLNTTLTKKDFKLPFVLDVTQVVQQNGHGSNSRSLLQSNNIKRKLPSGVVIQPVKKQMMDVGGTSVPGGARNVLQQSPQRNGKSPSGVSPTVTKYVPILPKGTSLQQNNSPSPSPSQKPLKVYPGAISVTKTEDDFAPKIENISSVVITPVTASIDYKPNGITTRPPPQLLPAKTVEVTPMKKPKLMQQNKDSGFLGCKTCGKTFPCNLDNLFRNHNIIQHNKEVTDEDIKDSKIKVASWYQCRNCSIMLLNNLEEHHRGCCSTVPFQQAFDAIPVDSSARLVCGVCQAEFESRIWLKRHLEFDHNEIHKKVILDPFFRCATCLLFFNDAAKLIVHAYQCTSSPSLETQQELAQKNLYCEICGKKHSKIRETLFCYQVKQLLRCVLCLHVSASRQNFFAHLKTYHGKKNGICCPFCPTDVEQSTREVFDHCIDSHYNAALKRAGDAALARGRQHLQAQSQAFKSAGLNALGGAVGKSVVNQNQAARKPPVLKPIFSVSSSSPGAIPVTNGNATTGMPTTIRIPVSQYIQGGVLPISQHIYPGSIIRPITISSKGVVPQVPAGFLIRPATTIEAFNSSNLTLEPVNLQARRN